MCQKGGKALSFLGGKVLQSFNSAFGAGAHLKQDTHTTVKVIEHNVTILHET